jgi:hypothetical protein
MTNILWRTSSRSAGNGACVEVGGWRTSTSSGAGNCVEVGHADAVVGVRDTKLAESPVLVFSAEVWRAFTVQVRKT